MSRIDPHAPVHSIAGRIGVTYSAILALAVALAAGAAWSVVDSRRAVVASEGARILAVASTLAGSFDAAALAEAETDLAGRDRIAAWADAPEGVVQLQQRLARAVADNGITTPIYTLSFAPGAAERVAAAPSEPVEGGTRFGLTSSVNPYWHHEYNYRPEMAATLLHGQATVTAPYGDDHGRWLSAYAPLWVDGQVVALLEVDTELDALLARAVQGALSRSAALAGVAAVFVGLLLMVVGAMRSIVELAQAARRFGAGDRATPFPAVSGSPEVRELAAALEGARVALGAQDEELRDALAQAEGATRAKSQFLANMSHELRTPLNAVIGYSEMLLEDAEDMGLQEATSDLERIRNAGRHLLAIINDVLDLSKIEAGRMELFLESTSIDGLVREVADTIGPMVEGKGNQLIVTVEPGLPRFDADVTRLRQILFNLLSNASKFTEAGEVELEVFVGKSDAEFGVTGSFGIAMASGDALPSPSELIEQADQALYEAKAAGRDRVQLRSA